MNLCDPGFAAANQVKQDSLKAGAFLAWLADRSGLAPETKFSHPDHSGMITR